MQNSCESAHFSDPLLNCFVSDADVVCLQEVAPASFEDDFKFMAEDLGYDGVEMFKKGRFRPATFWKTSSLEITAPPVHKDRTLLTPFRRKANADDDVNGNNTHDIWYVLNCHLQAGNNAPRRVRQINEGVRSVMTLARKQKQKEPEKSTRLIVCGDFNGGDECGAVRYLEDGYVDETCLEDGEPVTSSKKIMPLSAPMADAAKSLERNPPATMVVSELISQMVEGDPYDNPKFSATMLKRLETIYKGLATHTLDDATQKMNIDDVEKWLKRINLELGRGDEFREAARQMGWVDPDPDPDASFAQQKTRITLPRDGYLSLEGFINVYLKELNAGKFWGICHDMAVLGEPLPDNGVFQARYDRIYHSKAIRPVAVVDTCSEIPCPNPSEPSDHLPVAALFTNEN